MAKNGSQSNGVQAVDPHKGTLFVFNHNPWKKLTAFRTGESKRALVTIGGQADTFFSLNYLEELTGGLVKAGWCAVQALFTSWYSAFGQSTLENDSEDLDMLLMRLSDMGVEEVALLGYHTGVQDVLHYLQAGIKADMVTRIILQGGVRQPQSDITYQHVEAAKDTAKQLILEGRGNSVMPAHFYPIPISAFRYMSLGCRQGVQEVFSMQQDADEMAMVVGHVKVPCLVLFCLSDNYKPTEQQKAEQWEQIREAMQSDVICKWVEQACDENLNFLRGFETELSSSILDFLAEEDRKEQEKAADRQRELEAAEKRKRSVVFQAKGGAMKRSPSQVSVASTAEHGK